MKHHKDQDVNYVQHRSGAFVATVDTIVKKMDMRQLSINISTNEDVEYILDTQHYKENVKREAIAALAKGILESDLVSTNEYKTPQRTNTVFRIAVASPDQREMMIENQKIIYDNQVFSFGDVEKALEITFPERFL